MGKSVFLEERLVGRAFAIPLDCPDNHLESLSRE
jgi:hypothetical protein